MAAGKPVGAQPIEEIIADLIPQKGAEGLTVYSYCRQPDFSASFFLYLKIFILTGIAGSFR